MAIDNPESDPPFNPPYFINGVLFTGKESSSSSKQSAKVEKSDEELVADFIKNGGKPTKYAYVEPVVKRKIGYKVDGRKECRTFIDAKRITRPGGRYS